MKGSLRLARNFRIFSDFFFRRPGCFAVNLVCPLFRQFLNLKSRTPKNGSPWGTDKPEFFLEFFTRQESGRLELKIPKIDTGKKKKLFLGEKNRFLADPWLMQ